MAIRSIDLGFINDIHWHTIMSTTKNFIIKVIVYPAKIYIALPLWSKILLLILTIIITILIYYQLKKHKNSWMKIKELTN